MPTYAYKCCDYEAVVYKVPIAERVKKCPACGKAMHHLITREHAAKVQSPRLDNQMYNNGQGMFDKGLGVRVTSRAHHEKIMREKGVAVYKGSFDDVMIAQEPKEPKPMALEKVKDIFDESVARVKRGEKPVEGTFTDAPPVKGD